MNVIFPLRSKRKEAQECFCKYFFKKRNQFEMQQRWDTWWKSETGGKSRRLNLKCNWGNALGEKFLSFFFPPSDWIRENEAGKLIEYRKFLISWHSSSPPPPPSIDWCWPWQWLMLHFLSSLVEEEISLTRRKILKAPRKLKSICRKKKCLKTFQERSRVSLSLISLANDSVFHQHPSAFYVQSLVSHFSVVVHAFYDSPLMNKSEKWTKSFKILRFDRH